jgi:hypothetical protein
MILHRREFLVVAGALTGLLAPPWAGRPITDRRGTMHGLIGKMSAVAGQSLKPR